MSIKQAVFPTLAFLAILCSGVIQYKVRLGNINKRRRKRQTVVINETLVNIDEVRETWDVLTKLMLKLVSV